MRFVAAVTSVFLLATGSAGAATVTRNVRGDDWSLPAGPNAPNSGFYSEAGNHFGLRGFDLTWRQIEPTEGTFDPSATGNAEDMDLPSFAAQNADPSPFWMRMFASATSWAPEWLAKDCSYTPVGPDDDRQMHVPIWDPCVWPKLREAWRMLMVDQGLRSDPRLRFVYVPGAFTWVEYDYDMVDRGVKQGLGFDAYSAWYHQMLQDLVGMMGEYSYKLVFTGEDYPFSNAFGDKVALFAKDAVDAGMGIRNGITELFDFHLNEIPAYGTTIGPDGHLVTDDDWKLFDGKRIAATENECYTDCGLHSKDPNYAVKMSDLKALQMRLNWIYVVPGPSRFSQLPGLWAWVRRELGQRPESAPDAWVALRDAEDGYWADRGDKKWKGFPYVRNLERWLVQRGPATRGHLKHAGDPSADNRVAYESLRTKRSMYFDLADRFGAPPAIDLKVTYRDFAHRRWRVDYRAVGGITRSTPAVRGARRGTGALRTVTFHIDDFAPDNGLPRATDFALHALRGELEASFVRLVRR